MTPPTIIERVISEADLIERQLRQPGMYPPPRTPLSSTSGFVPKPSSTFQPIASAAPPPAVNTHQTDGQQSAETSPGSSLPCGQRTPIGSANVTSTPSQHTPPQSVVPPQPATPQSYNPNNIHSHTQSQNTPQSTPLHNLGNSLLLGQVLICSPSLSFQLQTHKLVSSSSLQHIPKSVNGEGVKAVNKKIDPVHQMDNSAFL